MVNKPIRIEIRREGNTLAIVRMDTQARLDVTPLDDIDGAKRSKRKWEKHYNR